MGAAAKTPLRPRRGDGAAVTAEQVRALLDNTDADIDVPGLPLPEEQVPIAQAVIATGAQMGISAHGQVVALATALQESNLRNLPYGDRDSLGVFQQRPSMGWGTPAQILDPVYASQKFYEGLQKIDGWEEMPVTEAAQAVQRSAYPDAYAKHEPLATALQQAIGPTLGTSPTAAFGGRACSRPDRRRPGGRPAGQTARRLHDPARHHPQARAAIEWALQQLGGAYQWGGSCTNPRGAEPRDRCDCSSLMQRAYGVAGCLPLPHHLHPGQRRQSRAHRSRTSGGPGLQRRRQPRQPPARRPRPRRRPGRPRARPRKGHRGHQHHVQRRHPRRQTHRLTARVQRVDGRTDDEPATCGC